VNAQPNESTGAQLNRHLRGELFSVRELSWEFGLLNLHGIAKPVYRAWELLHHLSTERMPVEGVHNTIDAWVVRDGRSSRLGPLTVQPRQPIATKPVSLLLLNAPAPQDVYVERIDDAHANPDHRCTEIGEPIYLTTSEIEQLKEASRTG
jgi:xylan 1,4-beta-xylosidase